MLPTASGEFRAVGDPELRFTPSGKQVANVRLVASDRRKTDNGGWEDAEQLWCSASVWDLDAERVVESIQKGDLVLVTGRVYVRDFERQDGSKGSAVEFKYAKLALLQKKGAAQRDKGGATAPADDPWATNASQQNAQQQQSDPWSNNQQQIDEPPF